MVVVKVYLRQCVCQSVVLVATPSEVPAALFRFNFARGNIVPEVVVFLSQSSNVIVEPAGIVPAAFGTPLCVSNCLMTYSPAATFFRLAVWIASTAASGLAGFNWKRFVVVEASRWSL